MTSHCVFFSLHLRVTNLFQNMARGFKGFCPKELWRTIRMEQHGLAHVYKGSIQPLWSPISLGQVSSCYLIVQPSFLDQMKKFPADVLAAPSNLIHYTVFRSKHVSVHILWLSKLYSCRFISLTATHFTFARDKPDHWVATKFVEKCHKIFCFSQR